MADESSTSGFTAGETKIITCIMKHLKGDIQVRNHPPLPCKTQH